MANNLAKCRAKHGLTQEELGKKLGLSRAGVNYLEKHKLTAKAALKCAQALDENVFTLLGSDVFQILPSTEEDREALSKIVSSL